ncbi:MAG TPA: hypothetical protein QF753_07960 [Victivallales bacterium]|nr:hypothetical protein [Victivallales bacterium]
MNKSYLDNNNFHYAEIQQVYACFKNILTVVLSVVLPGVLLISWQEDL